MKPAGTIRFIYNGHGKRHCVTVPLCTDATVDYDYVTQEVTIKARGRYLAQCWAFETIKFSDGGEQ